MAAQTSNEDHSLFGLIHSVKTQPSEHARQVLKRNHEEHDIFFGHKGFHNHLVHHILTADALGAIPARLDEIATRTNYLNPIPVLQVVEIDEENWREFVGKGPESAVTHARPQFYRNFLDFFEREISHLGIPETVLRYAFDPALMPCLPAGAVHPLIHLGFGVEFEEPMVVAEALAQACSHEPAFTEVLRYRSQLSKDPTTLPTHSHLDPPPDSHFRQTTSTIVAEDTSDQTGKLGDLPDLKDHPILLILEEIRRDKRIDGIVRFEDENKIGTVLCEAAREVAEYSLRWNVEENPTNIATRLQELYQAATLLYAATSVRPTHTSDRPKLDFFLMHVLTSIHALRQILPHLPPHYARTLLTLHFSCMLAYYISRGRPSLHIETMMEYDGCAFLPDADERKIWERVIKRAIENNEPHVVKVVRALKRGEEMWGRWEGVWLIAARMTVDVGGEWTFEPVGFEETWRHRIRRREEEKEGREKHHLPGWMKKAREEAVYGYEE